MAYGIKISLPGKDVSSTDPRDFAVHSDYPSPVIDESLIGTTTYTWSSNLAANETRNLFTLAHGYAYTPKSMCMVTDGTDFDGSRFTIPAPFDDGSFQWQIRAYTDGTNFKIDLVNTTPAVVVVASGLTYTFKYYILTDESL